MIIPQFLSFLLYLWQFQVSATPNLLQLYLSSDLSHTASKSFTCANLLNFSNNSIIIPTYRFRNWGTERVNLIMVTLLRRQCQNLNLINLTPECIFKPLCKKPLINPIHVPNTVFSFNPHRNPKSSKQPKKKDIEDLNNKTNNLT